MSLGAHLNPQASNSSTRTAAGLASAFAKASRKSARSADLDLPFGHDAEFIDKNDGRQCSVSTSVSGQDKPSKNNQPPPPQRRRPYLATGGLDHFQPTDLCLAGRWLICSTDIRRAEVVEGEIPITLANEAALRRALETAGVKFIDENGGGSGVRLHKPQRSKGSK